MAQLAELIAKRQATDARRGYKRRRADKRHLHASWIRSQPGLVYFGGESVTIVKRRLKYVAGWAPYFPYTAGELARLYLDGLIRDQLGDKRLPDHWKMTPVDEAKLAIQAPLYFDPSRGRDGRFVYIDIAACYFELMKGWPLNVGFNPATGKILMPRPEVRIPESDWEWLRREKPLRHAIFGMLAAPEIGWYRDGVWEKHKTLGLYGAPDLVALVKTRLREIARDAVQLHGCHMWLTDAGIVPQDRAPALLLCLALRGLSGHVRAQGAGHLYAQGSYRIGRLRTHTGGVDMPGMSNL